MSSPGPINYAPIWEARLRILRGLMKKYFPEMQALEELELQIESLETERIKLLDRKFLHTNVYKQEVVKANLTRCNISDFEEEQLIRVQAIQGQLRDARDRIAKLKKEKDAKLAWMARTGVMERPGWYSDGESDESVKLTEAEFNLTIHKEEEKQSDLKARFEYEGSLYVKLRVTMEDFVVHARLEGHEAALWTTRKGELEDLFKFTRSQLPDLREKAFAWMEKAFGGYEEQAKLETKHLRTGFKPDVPGEDPTSINALDNHLLNNNNKRPVALVNSPDLQNQGTSYTLSREISKNVERQPGHPGHPSHFINTGVVAKPERCKFCKKENIHPEERCWKLHPELKEQWLAKQKKKGGKLLCEFCRKTGHIRRFCQKLHPDLHKATRH